MLRAAPRVQPRVKYFRDTHHRLARLCAVGLRNEEICRATGYSVQRLSTLRQDPAFQELVASYREKVDIGPIDELAETAVSNMLRMERQVEHHLDNADEAGELIPLKTLFAGISDRADRFGYPKRTVNANVNINFAKHLEEAAARQGRATVIDGRSSPTIDAPGIDPSSPSVPGAQTPAAVGIRRRG